MSGGGGQAKQAVGALGAITAVLAAPATGGASLAALPGAFAAVKSGTKDVQSLGRATRNMFGDLLKPISKPKEAPVVDSGAVAQAKTNELLQLQNRSGRGSTILTNQFGG